MRMFGDSKALNVRWELAGKGNRAGEEWTPKTIISGRKQHMTREKIKCGGEHARGRGRDRHRTDWYHTCDHQELEEKGIPDHKYNAAVSDRK